MCVAGQLKLSEPVHVELRGGVDGVDGGEDDEHGQRHLDELSELDLMDE